MDLMKLNEQFRCCLNSESSSIANITTLRHVYNATKHCQKFLSDDSLAKSAYNMTQQDTYVSYVLYSVIYLPQITCEINSCEERTKGWYNAYVIYLVAIFVIGVIGNSVVLLTFFKSPLLRTSVTNYFVTSLAAADILLVIFFIPIILTNSLHNGSFCSSLVVCRLYYSADVTFFVASITNIFVITVDRFFAVTKPYDYKHIVTHLRAKVVIVFVWLYSATWGLMVHYNNTSRGFDAAQVNTNKCVVVAKHRFYIIVFAVVFFIPSLIMLIIYVMILRIALGHAKMIDNRRTAINKNRRPSIFSQVAFFQNRKLELRATKIVLIVYGTFLVCWFPTIAIALVQKVSETKVDHPVLVIIFGEILPSLNCILNPFIYGILHRDFKHGIKRMIGVLHLKHQMRSNSSKKYNLDLSFSQARCTHRSGCNSPKSQFELVSPTPRLSCTPNTTHESIHTVNGSTPRATDRQIEEEEDLHSNPAIHVTGSYETSKLNNLSSDIRRSTEQDAIKDFTSTFDNVMENKNSNLAITRNIISFSLPDGDALYGKNEQSLLISNGNKELKSVSNSIG